jgi:protein disulfide-isomerase A1
MILLLLFSVSSGLEEVNTTTWTDYSEAIVILYANWWYYFLSSHSSLALASLENALSHFSIPSFKLEASTRAEEFKIKGFPQIFYYKNGDYLKFISEKSEESLIHWIRRLTSPVILENSEEKTSLRVQKEMCEQFESCLIATGLHSDLLKDIYRMTELEIYSLPGSEGLTLYQDYGEAITNYSGPMVKGAIFEFIEAQMRPAVLPLQRQYLEQLFKAGSKAMILFRDRRTRYYDSEIKAVGSALKGKIDLLVADVTDPLGKQLQQLLKIPDKRLPVVRILISHGGSLNFTQYNLGDEITSSSLLLFYEKYQKSLLFPYTLSQDLPKKPTENRVHVVVYQTFESIIKDSAKNVLLMYYTPYCSYSKSLLPVLEQLAYDLRQVANLAIGKYDAYNNAVIEPIKGFPTLRLYVFGSDHVDYVGERTLELLKAFVLRNIVPEYAKEL